MELGRARGSGRTGRSPSTTDDLSGQFECKGLSGLEPLVLLVLGLDDGNLTHPERLYGSCTASGAYEADIVGAHEDSVAGLADELHVGEDGEVVSVFELGPDALLGVGDVEKGGGVGGRDGASGDGGDEA